MLIGPKYICDWVTANSLTDHELVKCTNPATYQLEDEAFDMHHLCLAHADLHRTITGEVVNRIEEVQ